MKGSADQTTTKTDKLGPLMPQFERPVWWRAMPDVSPIPHIEPFAVRPKVAAKLDGCGITEFYKRLNAGEYETYVDGTARMVTVRSIRERQQRLLAAASGTPRENPSRRSGGPGRPRKVPSP
jgi:hypothetical protein